MKKVDIYSYGVVCWQILTMNPQPFKEYLELGSLELFIEAICNRNERPSLTDYPKPVKNLVKKFWDKDPNNRPDFQAIIEQTNICMVDCSLIYNEAKEFWRVNFDGKTEVNFSEFSKSLFEYLEIDLDVNDEKYACIDAMACQDGNQSRIVTLERFGRLLKWFGNLRDRNDNIVDKITSIMRNPWFHGEVSRDQLALYNREFSAETKKKRHFLIRFSETEPIEEHPFSITVWGSSGSTNYRINYDTKEEEYSVSYKDKKKENITCTDIKLSNLINLKLKKPLKLRNEIPSQYGQIFNAGNPSYAEKNYANETKNNATTDD